MKSLKAYIQLFHVKFIPQRTKYNRLAILRIQFSLTNHNYTWSHKINFEHFIYMPQKCSCQLHKIPSGFTQHSRTIAYIFFTNNVLLIKKHSFLQTKLDVIICYSKQTLIIVPLRNIHLHKLWLVIFGPLGWIRLCLAPQQINPNNWLLIFPFTWFS